MTEKSSTSSSTLKKSLYFSSGTYCSHASLSFASNLLNARSNEAPDVTAEVLPRDPVGTAASRVAVFGTCQLYFIFGGALNSFLVIGLSVHPFTASLKSSYVRAVYIAFFFVSSTS